MLPGILEQARTFLKEVIPEGGTAVDATAGNGYDTLFLTGCTGPEGKVYSFDIQQQAVDNTAVRLKNAGAEAEIIVSGHEHALHYIQEEVIDAAVFNLGYLPGSDKTVTTTPDTTIMALEGLLKRLKKGGRIVLAVYHGHTEGKVEKDRLLAFSEALSQKKFQVLQYQFINQKNSPPFLLIIEKK
jgi:16S rRNA C1402 N4-methylase RsmH